MTTPRTAGSLCSGVGMLDRSVETLFDVSTTWYAELDPAAATVYSRHWPAAPNLGDITAVDWHNVNRVGVFKAGFPCQPFSAAGPQRGTDDERHLWPTAVLPAITVLAPPVVVLENVEDLLRIEQGQVFAQVLADLDNLGYTTAWATVGACKVGSCHCRHRLFILAVRDTPVDVPGTLPVARRRNNTWAPFQEVLFGDAEAVRWPFAGVARDGAVWSLPSDRCGKGRLVLLPTPTARDAGRGVGWGHLSGRPLSEVAAVLPPGFGKYAPAVRRHEATFGVPAPEPTFIGRSGNPLLRPEFVEWMMRLPAGWVSDLVSPARKVPEGMISRKGAVKALGNGVVGAAASHALASLPTFPAAQVLLSARPLVVAA